MGYVSGHDANWWRNKSNVYSNSEWKLCGDRHKRTLRGYICLCFCNHSGCFGKWDLQKHACFSKPNERWIHDWLRRWIGHCNHFYHRFDGQTNRYNYLWKRERAKPWTRCASRRLFSDRWVWAQTRNTSIGEEITWGLLASGASGFENLNPQPEAPEARKNKNPQPDFSSCGFFTSI